ncbi:MAG: nicotinate-nucleotide adenylyltransferase [Maribacter sp.]|nr:nicotinate-nucleotide adenylyltransferase [Maribacter sp.]MBT8301334.1 nicotinate-nucleotide adenylyltransferase [Maribacter sp.]NND78924.1 nicotinate-nucleotide adenylyltransferase [Maribacter sp.]NNK17948.1 nicotinate-nucleotide adenylyltransferase [Maribacter sp.]NNK76003.1 nicotinate-nucleotide adenylyltransferase [Maribacter sp.]
MKKFIIGLFVIGLSSPVFAQVTEVEQLSEVVVKAVNYKYLNATDSKEVAVPVRMLELKAAAYNVKDKDFYAEDDYQFYTIYFRIPEGTIVAAYNPEGKIIRTFEKFKNTSLPIAVSEAIYKRFPNWTIVSDVYRVTYNEKKGVSRTYKLKLENGVKTMRIKIDEKGQFL